MRHRQLGHRRDSDWQYVCRQRDCAGCAKGPRSDPAGALFGAKTERERFYIEAMRNTGTASPSALMARV